MLRNSCDAAPRDMEISTDRNLVHRFLSEERRAA
jgi:hypothetical protein